MSSFLKVNKTKSNLLQRKCLTRWDSFRLIIQSIFMNFVLPKELIQSLILLNICSVRTAFHSIKQFDVTLFFHSYSGVPDSSSTASETTSIKCCLMSSSSILWFLSKFLLCHIYLPNPSATGRMQHEVNFQAKYNWFEYINLKINLIWNSLMTYGGI